MRRLRPRWLRGRGGDLPVVYVEQVRRGELEVLERLVPEDVAELRFLSAGDATLRFGTNHAGGAILVSLKR